MFPESFERTARPKDPKARSDCTSNLPSGSNGTESALQVRAARIGDSSAIADIYNDAICAGSSTMDTELVHPAIFASYIDSPERESILVGNLAGQTVGWGIVKRYSDRPGYRYACETSVYVASAFQHQGHGARILESVIANARGLGYRHLVAKILAVNESSIRFHRRFGFEIVGQQRAIGYLNGQWHDVVILQRIFEKHLA